MANEFQLSETTFPLRPTSDEAARGVDYRLRIFTPVNELPFAGHPSVGTAWLMARLGRVSPGTVVQACGAGDLPLDVPADGGPVELTGGEPTWTDPIDPADGAGCGGPGRGRPQRRARPARAAPGWATWSCRRDPMRWPGARRT